MPPHPISLGTRSNVGRDTAISAARLTNCYPENAGPEGKIQYPIVACDGFTAYLTSATSGAGAPRAALALTDSALYVVMGSKVIKVDGSATETQIVGKSHTATITIASPGVLTWVAHGLGDGAGASLATTGALPTGLVAATTYYVVNAATDTFQLAATPGGTAINTTGSQSGVHTASTASAVSASGFVTMARNRREPTAQIAIVTSDGHFYVLSGDTLVDYTGLITSLGSAGTLTSVAGIDGYFLLFFDNGEFFITSIDEGTAIDALAFAKAEANPDSGMRVIVRGRDVLLFGPKSVEGWVDSGAADFPFERSAASNIGCYAAAAVVALTAVVNDNTVDTVIWPGTNSDGSYAGLFMLSDGLQGHKISTGDVDRAIEAVADPTTLRAFTWARGGHVFYAITDLSTFTWVYDTATGFDFNRTSSGLSCWRIAMAVVFGTKILVGDYSLAKLYWMKDGFYDASNPCVFTLKHSNDNADTWVATRTKTISGASDRKQRTKLTRIGQSKEDGKVFNLGLSRAVMEDGTANDMTIQPPTVHSWPNPMRFFTLYIDTVPGVSQTSRSKAITGMAVDAIAVKG